MRLIFTALSITMLVLMSGVGVVGQVETDWSVVLTGTGENEDSPVGIGLDSAANCYVAGVSYDNTTYWDFVVAKYTAGVAVWERRYHGAGDSTDYALTMAVSSGGNVYVSGYTRAKGISGYDLLTVAFGPDGDTLWSSQLDLGFTELIRDIKILDDGSILLAGKGWSPKSVIIIKYEPDGDTLWARSYHWNGSTMDDGNHVDCDTAGNIFVVGTAYNGGQFDLLTVKFSPDGDTLWGRIYDGPGNGAEFARGIVTDIEGNVYVTAVSEGAGTNGDLLVLKYDSAGNLVWERRYDGHNNTDEPYGLVIDSSGNIYVAGGSSGSGTSTDVILIKYSPEGDTLWITREGSTAHEEARDIAWDSVGNIYIGGWRLYPPTYIRDYLIMKFDSSTGTKEWEYEWDASDQEDKGLFIAVGQEDHVWITGESITGGFPATGQDIATVKCKPLGTAVLEPHSPDPPSTFQLFQNVPNPFNATTVIRFDLQVPGHAELTIFDILGHPVMTLVEDHLSPGSYSFAWDGRDERGRVVSSGVYLYRLTTDRSSDSRKMTLLK